jgi:putative cardiolipin synthase
VGGLCWLALLALVALLTGCGTLPAPVASAPTLSLAPDPAGVLSKTVAASMPPGEDSGFRLLPLGVYSLEARVQLARRAQRSLDLQYYVFENDATGRLLLRYLKEAALRGVRVRLLVDDLYTADSQQLLLALSATPNIEVRLFNPFCCARQQLLGRFTASLFALPRLNHRMHNKLFIADGAMAIAGGRNIANDYFTLDPLQNFVDMDALMVGNVVPQLASIFDGYWNSPQVRPIGSIVQAPGSRKLMQQDFDEWVDMAAPLPALTLPPNDILGYGPVGEELDAGRMGLLWGSARAFADPPSKAEEQADDDALATSVTLDVLKAMRNARHDIYVVSPYLIPGERGMKALRDVRARGVKVMILTNSLAANDVPAVHTGYARYRLRLLQAGVDLYELSPQRTTHNKRLGMFGQSFGRLHAKMAVIDDRTVFIGSMNLDPRSATRNTELGVLIDSPQLAREMERVINITRLQSAYRLRLASSGSSVQWLTSDGEKEVILDTEPESSPAQRLYNFLLSPFVPESLL